MGLSTSRAGSHPCPLHVINGLNLTSRDIASRTVREARYDIGSCEAAKDSGGALQSEADALERDFGSCQSFDRNFQSLASTQEATRILETEQAESGSASSRLSSRHVRRHL